LAAAIIACFFSGVSPSIAWSAASQVVHDQSATVLENETWLISRLTMAQDFRLAQPTRLSRLRVWLAEGRPNGTNDGTLDGFDGLSWAIYHDAASQPGELIAQSQDLNPVLTDTPLQFAFGGDIVTADVALHDLLLAAGDYWLAVHEGPWGSTDTRSDSRIGWSTTRPGFGRSHYYDEGPTPGSNWRGPGSEQALTLYGEIVPEPSVVVLAVGAMAALLVRRGKVR
jgi:hypothetical protein